jgi:hypothetical protein
MLADGTAARVPSPVSPTYTPPRFPELAEPARSAILARVDEASAYWSASMVDLAELARRATLGRDFDTAAELGQRINASNELIGAVRLARRPEYLIGLWRWAWLRKLNLLAEDAVAFRAALTLWHAAGHPDGVDCCPACGSSSWKAAAVPEEVSVPVSGLVPTGRVVDLYRCNDCEHGRQLDLYA